MRLLGTSRGSDVEEMLMGDVVNVTLEMVYMMLNRLEAAGQDAPAKLTIAAILIADTLIVRKGKTVESALDVMTKLIIEYLATKPVRPSAKPV